MLKVDSGTFLQNSRTFSTISSSWPEVLCLFSHPTDRAVLFSIRLSRIAGHNKANLPAGGPTATKRRQMTSHKFFLRSFVNSHMPFLFFHSLFWPNFVNWHIFPFCCAPKISVCVGLTSSNSVFKTWFCTQGYNNFQRTGSSEGNSPPSPPSSDRRRLTVTSAWADYGLFEQNASEIVTV